LASTISDDIRRLFNDTIKAEWLEVRSLVPMQCQKSSLILTAAAGFTNVYENDIFRADFADHIRTSDEGVASTVEARFDQKTAINI
jgi:hypothetical protein